MLFEEKHLLLVAFKLLHSYSSLAPMNNLSVLKPTFLFFFFFILHPITIVTYKPTDDIALSCGTSGNSTGHDGRQWTGDENSKFAPIEQSNEKSVTAVANIQEVSVNTVPYMTARLSRSQFMYTFPVTPGQKIIRLHFYPTSYPGFDKYNDFFAVKAGTFTLLQNFSASILSDYWGAKSLYREYCLNVEEGDQKLNISFTPTFSPSNETYAFINAIEIVSMPTSLYYTSPSDNEGLHAVGRNDTLRIENDTALESLYRLNVGGQYISQMEDTGMYREWIDDSANLYPAAGAVSMNSTISLNWSKIPAYTAPEDVYRTARSMGTNLSMNMQSNLTWLFLVDYGFWFLIRLHFCEYDPTITAGDDRLFSISMDNKIAEEEFGVTNSSGGKGIPMYKDYAVMIENSTEPQSGHYWLYLTLRPFIGNYVDYVDVLLNGIEVFRLSNHGNLATPNIAKTVSLTVPVPVQPPSSPIQKSKTKKTLIIASVGSAVGLLLILSLFCCMLIWQLRKRKRSGSDYKPSWCWWWLDPNKGKSLRTTASLPDERCRHFSVAEIKAATHNFHEDLIIGTGGFGKVFKGIIDGGSVNEDPMAVAIKRLNPESRQGASEFWTEIEMLSHLRHVHLVSLIGYCNDEGEMILVYDFMINGTLRDHLYNTKNDPLPWTQRLVICKGAAIGLNYLHTELEHTIIHRDVKSTNILLDKKWTAKVSDFGLSKINPKGSLMNTLVKGTPGYMDPEYARGHPLTVKSDVYSFGVVLLEVLCARRAVDIKLGEDQASLAHWATKCIDNGTIYNIIDPNLMGKIAPECFKAFVGIVESCLRDEGIKRPTMNDVMEKLIFALELQEKADAEKEKIYPGGEYMYPAISFHVARYDDVDGGTDMDSSTYTSTTMDTLTTGTSSTS